MTEVIDGWLVPTIPGSWRAARVKTSVGPGDIVIPVIFPDYRVRLPLQTGDRRPVRVELGHAGVVVINGENGVSICYEWGRYDARRDLGQVRRRHVHPPSVRPVCRLRVSQLERLLSMLCRVAGEGTRVQAVIVPCDTSGHVRGTDYAESVRSSFARGRQPAGVWCAAPGVCWQSPFVEDHERIYAIGGNNCLNFAVEVARRGSGEQLPYGTVPSLWADGTRRSHGLTRVDYRRGSSDVVIDP